VVRRMTRGSRPCPLSGLDENSTMVLEDTVQTPWFGAERDGMRVQKENVRPDLVCTRARLCIWRPSGIMAAHFEQRYERDWWPARTPKLPSV